MAFYVLFALLALCSSQTMSPTTSPSPCSAPPGFFCNGGSTLICPIGAYCVGGAALNVSCYPVTACTVVGLSAQPTCYWYVSTLAGSGAPGASNGIGTAASFSSPYYLAILENSLLLADTGNNRIRGINFNGSTSTFAGTGAASSIDGDILSATIHDPSGITINNVGSIFVAQLNARRVRMISNGFVTTVVSSGLTSPLGMTSVNGSVFIADASGAVRVLSNSVLSNFATGLNGPNDVCADATRTLFYSANYDGNNLANITSSGSVSGLITSPLIATPFGCSVMEDGTIIATTNAHSLVKITPSSKSVLAGSGSGWVDGFGTNAKFRSPRGVATSFDGTIFVVDTGNHRIRQLTCVPCPASYYCFSGAPVLCPPGSYCPLSSVNATLCPRGSFSNAGASNCTVCPAGSFTASEIGSSSCQKCPGGHYCPAGTFSWARLNCGRGNYCPAGSDAPTPCPYQVPPAGGWVALQVQGPAFLVETAQCVNLCFWNLTFGDGKLSKC